MLRNQDKRLSEKVEPRSAGGLGLNISQSADTEMIHEESQDIFIPTHGEKQSHDHTKHPPKNVNIGFDSFEKMINPPE